jgi:hypothetical protein
MSELQHRVPCGIPGICEVRLGEHEFALLAGAPGPVPELVMRDILIDLAAQPDVPGQPETIQRAAIPDGLAVAVLHYRSGEVTVYCDRDFLLQEGADALNCLSPSAIDARAEAVGSGRAVRYQVIRVPHEDLVKWPWAHPASMRLPDETPDQTTLQAVICANLVKEPVAWAIGSLGTAQMRLRARAARNAGSEP